VSSAIVVGTGPNGLACAAALARDGVEVTALEAADEIGGGTRTSELTVPGVLHDECSAVHPMGFGSPFLSSLGLERHGLEWRWPEIDLAHPLDDGSAAVMLRSIDDTASALGGDGDAWRRLFGAPSRTFEALNEDLLRPILHVPRHPIGLVRFGAAAAMPIATVARMWRGEHAPPWAWRSCARAMPSAGPLRAAGRSRSPTRWRRSSASTAARSRPGPG
jgi:phytoene dehydrogenase-like protein